MDLKKSALICLLLTLTVKLHAQIDTVLLQVEASHLFPSFPVKSSFTSLLDRREGMDYMYAANMESGLGIYDISNPSVINPVLNWPIANFGKLDVSTIEQRGHSLFVGMGDFQVNTNASSGLAIVDITNPVTPFIKDSWDSTLFKHGISHLLVEGNYAYLATMTDGLIILDISNENNIVFKSHLKLDLNFPAPSNNAHNARGLAYINDTLYVCFDRGGLRAIDVSNKNNPVEIYKYINHSLNAVAAAAYNDVTLKGHYAFVSVDYCGLEVIDIGSIPFTSVQWINPWGCNSTNWSGASLHTNEVMLANHDSLLFVSAGQSELFVYDVTQPLNISKVGEYVNLYDTLATHGLDVWNNQVSLSFIHTPFHIPPFTPFFADPGGLKLLNYQYNVVSMSIHELPAKHALLHLSPNPNPREKLLVSCSTVMTGIRVYNSLGQMVFVDLDMNKKETIIDFSSHEKGVYMVSVETPEGPVTKKIMIH